MTSLHDFDLSLLVDEKKLIAGIDEVGRGPIAGPVCVAMVVLDKKFYHPLINDSKKLTSKKRQILSEYILKNCVDYKILILDSNKIDEIGIQNSIINLMYQVYKEIKTKPDITVIDYLELDIENSISLKKADQTSQAVACASIIAKVYRDNLMDEYSKIYPEYLFEKHKGYGTKKHYELINKFGLCPIHRKTYNLHIKENL